MAFVHTAHGLGQIVATESLRGRTRHKVAGPGFEVWLDAAQVRMAGDSGYREQEMYHYDTTPTDPDDGDVYSKSPVYVERDASLGDVNEDNSTTLPYNPEPQYPNDMWAHETTIQPGDYEIDAEERLSPSDSLSFDSERETFPAPNPDLFAKSSAANLGPKYASWMLASPEGDDSVSRFRRDPIQEINRLGYLWTGGVEQPDMAEYGRLVEADKMLREAAWADVRAKAQRLRREGRVHVLQRGPGTIYTNVDGDHGTYTTMIAKTGNTQSIDKWACSCDWGKWAFQRKISYVGRLCSHGYASYLELQSDHHKGNPGRFHAPRRTASLVDDFQDYVDDYRDGHVDIDAVDNFITLPEHNSPRLDADQVDDLYNWAWDNRTRREERDYKVPYTAATEPRLRTTPRSMTPDLTVVPGPEESYFVDVEEDERDTTAPDGIMHSAALVDANGNAYRVSNFWHTAAPEDETAVEDDEDAAPSTAGQTSTTSGQSSSSAGQSSSSAGQSVPVAAPGVETPRTPEQVPTTPSPEEEYGTSQADMGGMGGFDMSNFMDLAGPVIDGVSQFAMPIAEGIGSAIGNIGSGLVRGGYRYANEEDGGYHDGVTNSYIPEGKIEELRGMANEDPELGNTREQNRQVQDAVEYLRDHGFDASPRVAGRYLIASCCEDCGCEAGCCDCDDCKCQGSRRKANYDSGPATVFGGPPGGAFGQPGGGPWADRSYSGSGPDPKWWYSDSEEAIAEHLNSDTVDQVDPTEGSGETNYLTESERPAQGKSAYRLAGELHNEPDYEDWEAGPSKPKPQHHYEPDMEREGRFRLADNDMDDELLQSLGEEIEGIGQYGQFLDEAQALGDEDAEAAIEEAIADETDHVENFSEALHTAGMNDVVRRFQASGGGALAADAGGGNYGDDAIAGQARKFLAKTAGRVYSLAEQQELVDEAHPQGARNKPTDDDLAGTHYV